MQSRSENNRHYIRIQRGEELMQTLSAYLEEHQIHAGSVSGIGATDNAKLFFYSLNDKTYHERVFEGEFEILNISGNISLKDGKPWPHIHATLSEENFQCVGGHVESMRISVTCEIIIDATSTPIEREFDEETELKLWQL